MTDVAVIGAGPAGAWTAYLLATRGAKVMLFDPSHPREKPCGGGVTGRALAIVADAIGGQLPAVSIKTARFVDSSTGGSATVQLPGIGSSDRLVISSRRAFDGLLVAAARRAGAELVPSRVTHVERKGSRWCVHTDRGQTRSAQFLVGADGAAGLVRRRVAQRFRRAQLSIATGYFAHGVTSDQIVIAFITDPPGYLWSFPRPDHLAIGVCAQADAGVGAEALRSRTATWIQTTGVGAGARLEAYSWPIPSLSASDLESLEVSGPGWLLAGDAAGLVDPITREGIFFALRSATCAADAIASALQTEGIYAESVRAGILSELTRAARFKERFFRPRFIGRLVGALEHSEPIRRVMADLISGTQGYRGLKRRLAATFEVRLALQALMG